MNDLSLPSPIQKFQLSDPYLSAYELYIKREDLIHPDFGGNKWRKLKYNIEYFKKAGFSELITFGGPFSNHLAATASICRSEGITCVGIVRGKYIDSENPTLCKATDDGMKLIHIPKEAYKQKERAGIVKAIIKGYDNPLVIPEGGSNTLAKKGVKEMMAEVHAYDLSFDYLVVSGGTGMTAAGIIEGTKNEEVLVINALKNISLEQEVYKFLSEKKDNWSVIHDYTFGGFAKVTKELAYFINETKDRHDLPLDPIYNGKSFYGLLDMMKNKLIKPESRVLYIHTGGLQGIVAFNYANKNPEKRLVY